MATGDLTTVAAVRAWLDLKNDASDALLAQLITAASSFVQDSILQRTLAATAYVENYRGTGADTMLVRQFPIVSVASIAFSGRTITAAAAGNPPSNGFMFDGQELWLPGDRFPYREIVTVSYTAGYAAIPAVIAQAANELVGEAFKRRDRIGQSTKSLGGNETVSFDMKDMNATTKKALLAFQSVAPV